MVMSFSSEKARKQLLEYGVVCTFRKNRRKRVGKDWANEKRGEKAFADIYVEEIGEVNPFHDLTPYIEKSGFKSIDEWLREIKRLNDGRVLARGWLYKVTMEGVRKKVG